MKRTYSLFHFSNFESVAITFFQNSFGQLYVFYTIHKTITIVEKAEKIQGGACYYSEVTGRQNRTIEKAI